MKTFKKIASSTLAVIMMLNFVACRANTDETNKTKETTSITESTTKTTKKLDSKKTKKIDKKSKDGNINNGVKETSKKKGVNPIRPEKETKKNAEVNSKANPKANTPKATKATNAPRKETPKATTKQTVRETKAPTKATVRKTEAPKPTNKPTERKKVWVEPVYRTVDVYEDKPIYEEVTETYKEPVEKQVLDQPERTVKHEKWLIYYQYYYASSRKKAYNGKETYTEDNRLLDEGLPTNTTEKEEIHEGPLDNPDYYEWKKDISEYETIPATYKTVTEYVTKTRTVKKQVGTKKVKTGTKKELVKEGYWKYE